MPRGGREKAGVRKIKAEEGTKEKTKEETKEETEEETKNLLAKDKEVML